MGLLKASSSFTESSPFAERREPQKEWSARALLLGIALSALLSAANAYLGLFAGMTVSASIPAAVVSMGVLRVVRGGILENNLVQTAASAGESAAAGAIFTLPALILLGAWDSFPYWMCVALVGTGGALGVVFTALLRRPLVQASSLPFPEGVATAEVLRVGHGNGAEARAGLVRLGHGAAAGAVVKFFQSGAGWAATTVEGAARWGSWLVYGGGSLSVALLAVGAIVGLRVGLLVFCGGAVNWLVFVPSLAPNGETASLVAAWEVWSTRTRYLGVGAMTVAGLSALWDVRAAIGQAVRLSVQQLLRRGGPPTEDLPVSWLLCVLLAATSILTAVFVAPLGSLPAALLTSLSVLLLGFLFSSVAAYMAGLLGSSNNPVSGVTIATILLVSLTMLAAGVGVGGAAGPAAAIVVGSVVCTAAAIGGDNVQDLKAGQLLGASPRRQQLMQLVGVATAALVLGPVLQLLADGYGFGAPTEAKPQPLRAPQATLMASVARGVFARDLPLDMMAWGAALGLGAWALDAVTKGRGQRFPPLAFALGLYLPWEMSVPVALGGVLRSLLLRRGGAERSLLLSSAGLITGESLMGVALAAVVGVTGASLFVPLEPPSLWLGLAAFAGCAALLLIQRRAG